MSAGTLGLFGGSFDPPHVGHLLTACYVLASEAVSELWIVPTFSHPFGKTMSAFEHRLHMCKLAFADLARCRVSPIERELGRTNYTLELVQAVAAREPDRELRLVLGSDHDTSRWRRFDAIAEIARPLWVRRGGHPHPELPDDAPEMPEVSSTHVRALLNAQQDATPWVPARVARYAREQRLYRETP